MKWFVIKTLLVMAPCLALAVELAIVRWGMRPSRRLFDALALFGVIAAGKFAGFQFFGGNDFNPELPVWLIIVWGWLESIVWVALPVSVFVALVAWLVKPFRRFALVTAFALSVLGASWGMWEGVRVPPVVEREVFIEGLPSEFDGYRLAHLSDLHCSSAARRGKIAAIVRRTNAARPDLVAITGDLVDGFPRERATDLEPLKDLCAKDGVIACTGNHECYFQIDVWEPYYRQWGVRLLRNEWMVVDRGDAKLVIGGEDDSALGSVPATEVFRGAPTDGCRIILRHRPVRCDASALLMNARLQLSGHTHGGAMPIIAHFVALENQRHVRGFYREGKLTLHVSPGTGQWAGFPLRLFNPPEITVLVLRSGILL